MPSGRTQASNLDAAERRLDTIERRARRKDLSPDALRAVTAAESRRWHDEDDALAAKAEARARACDGATEVARVVATATAAGAAFTAVTAASWGNVWLGGAAAFAASGAVQEIWDTGGEAEARSRGRHSAHDSSLMTTYDLGRTLVTERRFDGARARAGLADGLVDVRASLLNAASPMLARTVATARAARLGRGTLAASTRYVHDLDPTRAGCVVTGGVRQAIEAKAWAYHEAIHGGYGSAMWRAGSAWGGAASQLPGSLAAVGGEAGAAIKDGRVTVREAARVTRTTLTEAAAVALAGVSGWASCYVRPYGGLGTAVRQVGIDGATNLLGAEFTSLGMYGRYANGGEVATALAMAAPGVLHNRASREGSEAGWIDPRDATAQRLDGGGSTKRWLRELKSYDYEVEDWEAGRYINPKASPDRVRTEDIYEAYHMMWISSWSGDARFHPKEINHSNYLNDLPFRTYKTYAQAPQKQKAGFSFRPTKEEGNTNLDYWLKAYRRVGSWMTGLDPQPTVFQDGISAARITSIMKQYSDRNNGGRPLAFIEINGHGAPNGLVIGGETIELDSLMRRLSHRGVIAPGSCVTFTSCNVMGSSEARHKLEETATKIGARFIGSGALNFAGTDPRGPIHVIDPEGGFIPLRDRQAPPVDE